MPRGSQICRVRVSGVDWGPNRPQSGRVGLDPTCVLLLVEFCRVKLE